MTIKKISKIKNENEKLRLYLYRKYKIIDNRYKGKPLNSGKSKEDLINFSDLFTFMNIDLKG